MEVFHTDRGVRALRVSKVEADEVEIKVIEEDEQYVGMFLEPGACELGFTRSSLTLARYDTGNLFIFPRRRRAFVRRIEACYLLVRVSDRLMMEPDELPNVIQTRCQRHFEDKRVQGLMVSINAERLAGFPSGRLFLDSIDLAIGLIIRQKSAELSVSTRTYRNGLTPMRLRRVIELINENLQYDLSLQQLADTAGLSVSHFSRMFRSSTGLSPHRYLLQRRVYSARELLRHSSNKVLDVASECGFKTQQHFARAFRGEFGVNPTEYRRL